MKLSFVQLNAIRFGATIAVLLGITAVSCISLIRFKEANRQVRQTEKLLQQIEIVLSQLKDAETGQRGYLLTGKDSYLQPYQAAVSTLNQEVDELAQLIRNNPHQQERIVELRSLISTKLTDLGQTIALRKSQGYEAALRVVETERGRKIMDRVRVLAADLKQEQQDLSEQQLELEEERGNRVMWLIISGISLELLLVTGTALRLGHETQNLRQLQNDLLHSEQRYRSLVMATAQIVWITDALGQVSDTPSNWLEITGQTEQEVKGTGWLNAVHPADQTYVSQQWQQALANQKLYEGEYRLRTADNGYRNFSSRGVPVWETDGSIREWVGICVDITDRKQAEQALRESKDELEQRVQARTRELTEVNTALQAEIAERLEIERQIKQIAASLKQSNQELEQFAYVASHDLQEPLRAVASYTQLLAQKYQGHLDEKADKYIGYIVGGATRMQQLIGDLLAYSRVGRQKLNLQLIDCNTILEQVLHLLQIAITESNAVVTYDSLPTVTADAAKLIQLFQNLISNALKYRDQAVPEVHISSVISPDGGWIFSVKDNGIGIDSQYAERIFVIFQRLHTRRNYSGTGIGLAICKKIVELHQGQIWVESELGQGATFYFTLPCLERNNELLLQEVAI